MATCPFYEELSQDEDISLYVPPSLYRNPSPPPDYVEDVKGVDKNSMPPPDYKKPIEIIYTGIRKKIPKKKDILPKPASDLVNENWTTYGDEFRCSVCQLTLNSVSTFNAHMQGKKHARLVKETVKQKDAVATGKSVLVPSAESKYEIVRFGGDAFKVEPQPIAGRALIQDKIDQIEDPCIGLEYVTEILRLDRNSEPLYNCYLCTVTCQVDSIVSHITGRKHRLCFLKKNSVPAYEAFNKDQRKDILLRCIDDWEKSNGRGEITCKREIEPNLDDVYMLEATSGAVVKPAKKPLEYVKADLQRVDFKKLTVRQYCDLLTDLVETFPDSMCSKNQCTTLQYGSDKADEKSLKYFMKKAPREAIFKTWIQDLSAGKLEEFQKTFHRSLAPDNGEDLRICLEKMEKRGELEIVKKTT